MALNSEGRDWNAIAAAANARQDSVSLPDVVTIASLIEHVRTCVEARPSAATRKIVAQYAREFDACAGQTSADLHLFTFHVAVPPNLSAIEYVDVRHDQAEFDYERLLRHFVWAASAFNPRARVVLTTGPRGVDWTAPPHLRVARLETDRAAPMLERVRAMAAYVNSRAFSADTVFLDTDAFANCPLTQVFRGDFDIGVTFRTDPGYMPLNEGVIFCARARLTAVRRFFDMYLATYERLILDARVRAFYQNIERWRGGQLSLNAVACPAGDLSTLGRFVTQDVRIGLMPCETHNYWVRSPSAATWDDKLVLHLRGESKRLVDSLIEYQFERARRVPGFSP